MNDAPIFTTLYIEIVISCNFYSKLMCILKHLPSCRAVVGAFGPPGAFSVLMVGYHSGRTGGGGKEERGEEEEEGKIFDKEGDREERRGPEPILGAPKRSWQLIIWLLATLGTRLKVISLTTSRSRTQSRNV